MGRSLFVGLLFVAACEADTRTLDLTGRAPDAGAAGCRQIDPSITTGVLEGLPRFIFPVSALRVSGGLVYSGRRANVTAIPQVVAFDPVRGEEEALTDPSVESHLVDARAGALLWLSGGPSPAASLLHRDGDGPAVLLAVVENWHAFRGFDTDEYRGRSIQVVDRASASWLESDAVFRWDADRGPQRIGAGEGYVTGPSVRNGRVAWASHDAEGNRIRLHALGREALTIATGQVEAPALSNDQVFFVKDGALMRFDIGTRATDELHPGPCGPPFSDGDRAVAACGGGRDWFAPGELIVYWDGVRAHELFEDSGYHFAPRLDRGRIAWIRYHSTEVVCGSPAAMSAGEVRLWDPDAGNAAIALAEVSAPCLCCDAFWPPAVLAFEGEVLAWNYAYPDEDRGEKVGWARIEEREVCSP